MVGQQSAHRAQSDDKHISQAVIASHAGLSREVVNKTMRELENRSLVRCDQDGVHVADHLRSPICTSPTSSPIEPCICSP